MESSDAAGVARATALFRASFGADVAPTVAAAAPGRINIIGEHTDYNDGFVFPLALDKSTYVVGAPCDRPECDVVTEAFPESLARFPPTDLVVAAGESAPKVQHGAETLPNWARVVRGMVALYARDGHKIPAFRAAVVSDVPMGSGLSSSAALEMATAVFIEQLVPVESPDPSHRAKLGQTCEHEFAGVPCGIMDQLVSSRGKAGAALLIDCRSLQCTPVPLSDPDVVVFVANSNVQHQLSGSEYPQRRAQCAEAARAIAAAHPSANITHLRDATIDQLESITDTLPPETTKRARHVILEDRRTIDTKAAFDRGDYVTAGKNMVASHESLRDLFEVSTPEIDALVKIAMSVNGVYGSRITGGGFGGSTVTLVRKDAVKDLVAAIDKHYPEHSNGRQATMFATGAGPGARTLSELL